MNKSLIVLLLIINAININAQKNFYIGAGILYQTFESYSFIDYGPLIYTADDFSLTPQEPEYELIFGSRVYKNFYLELNFKLKKYYIGYTTKLSKTFIGTHRMLKETIQIPVKAKYQFRLNDKFSISPNIGAVYCYEFNNNSDLTFDFINPPEFKTVEVLKSEGFKNFFLGLIGLDVEYKFFKRHSLNFSFNYFKGWEDMITRGINYYVTDNPTNYSAKIFGNGTYFSYGLSYRYLLINSAK